MEPEKIDGYFEIASKYGSFLAQIYLHPAIFFILVAILITVYVVMYFLMTREAKSQAIEKNVWLQFRIYIGAHMLIQMFICFVTSYLIIKFADALWENYIINWVVSPIVGIIIGLILDRSVIMKLENYSNNFVNPLIDAKTKEAKPDKGKLSNVDSHMIQINVGTNIQPPINNSPLIDVKTVGSEGNEDKDEKDTKEDVEIGDTEMTINETTEAAIRSLIEVQKQQGEELKRQSEMLDAIRGSIMNDKRILLKKNIYECINKGYVTPEEDERIRIEYQSYTGLGGNSEIHSLYEERFVSLPVHN